MSLLRILLAIFALTAAYLGFEETRLARRCPVREVFWSDQLQSLALRVGPIWAEIEAWPVLSQVTAPRSERFDRYLPVAADSSEPDRYGAPLVFLIQPAYSDAVAVAASGAVRAGGLCYVPDHDLEADIRQRIEASGVRLAPGFRVLEVGRIPSRWAGPACFAAGGGLFVLLAFLRPRKRRELPPLNLEPRVFAATSRPPGHGATAEVEDAAPPDRGGATAPRRRTKIEVGEANDHGGILLDPESVPCIETVAVAEPDPFGAETSDPPLKVLSQRFPEFAGILTAARQTLAVEQPAGSRVGARGRCARSVEAPEDETLAILESCSLSALPGADLLAKAENSATPHRAAPRRPFRG